MLTHSLLVESVALRRLGGSAGENDSPGDNFDGRPGASREKKLGPLTRKGTRDSAADPASSSVDHRNLVLEHHLSLFFAWVVTPAHLKSKTGVRAVEDPDTTTPRKWARAFRPVRPPPGVYIRSTRDTVIRGWGW